MREIRYLMKLVGSPFHAIQSSQEQQECLLHPFLPMLFFLVYHG